LTTLETLQRSKFGAPSFVLFTDYRFNFHPMDTVSSHVIFTGSRDGYGNLSALKIEDGFSLCKAKYYVGDRNIS